MIAKTVSSVELELTYLAKAIPVEIKDVQPTRVVDIYVPEITGVHPRLRLRQKGEKYEITKKIPVNSADASVQKELTIPLNKGEFKALSSASGKRVVKDRYKVVIGGTNAEVDVFREGLKGLIVIDFEFSSKVRKEAFMPPEVCLADVTQETFIAGGSLAGKTLSDIKSQLAKYAYRPIVHF